MRSETASAWIFASLCLLATGVAVYIFNNFQPDTLAGFLAVMGVIYFGIGSVLTVIHDRHMAKRTRAGCEGPSVVFIVGKATIFIILLISISVIAVDVAWSIGIENTAVYQSLRDSLSRFSSAWRLRLQLLNKDSCPKCLSTNIRRSHRYSFEKPVSVFGLWPYHCSDCKARFRKTLGRHFVQPTSFIKR